MSCICEKHKDELKSLSLNELDEKIQEQVLKHFELAYKVKMQAQIVDLLIAEMESRQCLQ
jgi:hypothetical protein